MVAPLVTLVTMLPFISIPSWSVELILVEQVHLLQLLQVLHLLSIHSLEVDSSSVGMIYVSS